MESRGQEVAKVAKGHDEVVARTPSGVELTRADFALLSTMGGATFAPGTTMRLPSGAQLPAEEAQAITDLYTDDEDD